MKHKFLYFCISVLFSAMFTALADLQLGEREVATYYLESGTTEVGSPNIVNSIVWDFRGYDTLGEETVMFTAALGVFLVAERLSTKKQKEKAND